MAFKDPKFELHCLEAHNKYRALHGCPPLRLSPRLTEYAAEWAQNLARRGGLGHRSNNKYGENLFMAMDSEVTGERVVQTWYNEGVRYNFGSARFDPAAGHFTQVIWRRTRELGIGIAKKGTYTWVVANYDPPGNMLSDFKANVTAKVVM